MKDEEKAKKIAQKNKRSFSKEIHDGYNGEVSWIDYSTFDECYKSAIEMAEWKEKQLITWLENNASNYVVCNDFAEFSHYATKTMIEDLKKYMEL